MTDYTVLFYTSSIVLSVALQPQKSNETTMAKEQPSFSIITHIGPSVAVLQMSSGQGAVPFVRGNGPKDYIQCTFKYSLFFLQQGHIDTSNIQSDY